MILTVRPIEHWPGELTRGRKDSPFFATYGATLQLLERELEMIGARHPVLQMAVREDDIRLDGQVRANATPVHPGVILSFETRGGPLSFPCDRFLHWHANIRAIALGLEALRKVDRYGITRRGEQYTGWKALPPGVEMPAAQMSVEAAVRLLAETTDAYDFEDLLAEIDSGDTERPWIKDAFRMAAKRLHPDTGGDGDAFARLDEARRVIEKHRSAS